MDIFDNFWLKYLPSPESYNTSFTISYGQEIVIGGKIFKSHASYRMQQLQLLQTVDDEKLCPLAWKENINSSKKFLNFFLTNIKKFHVEMVRSGASQEEIINFFFTRVVIEIE